MEWQYDEKTKRHKSTYSIYHWAIEKKQFLRPYILYKEKYAIGDFYRLSKAKKVAELIEKG